MRNHIQNFTSALVFVVLALLLIGLARADTMPPPAMVVLPGTHVQITWPGVVKYSNGGTISSGVAANLAYKLYASDGKNIGFMGYIHTTSYLDTTLTTEQTKCYTVSSIVYNPNATESAKTPYTCVQVSAKAPAVPMPPGQICTITVK